MKIAGYCRISVDTEKDQDNTSIENQRDIITAYVKDKFPSATLDFFVDRDRSGYTFEQRENYQIMRKKLMSGAYDILIIKDFSRFSRRNSLGLYELEVLRDHHVRIISIGDSIDFPGKDEWMLIQFKFLMNELPVTDTSKKIRAIITAKQKTGDWVCAVPYGYVITNTKEMTYEVDPSAAVVVREIFDLYLNGYGYKKIAETLTARGVPTPRANEIIRKEAKGQSTRIRAGAVWSTASISGVLHNDFYIGTLRQRKYTRERINGRDRQLAADENIVIERAHEAIIDDKTFALVQDQLKRRSTSHYRGIKKYDTSYSGFLVCGDCGSPMFSMSRPDLAPAYVCGTYHRRGRKGCTSHHIRVDKLDEVLKRYIKRVMDSSEHIIEELNEAITKEQDRESNIGNSITLLEQDLENARNQLKNVLKRKVLDTMNATPEQAAVLCETYDELQNEITNRISDLEQQIASSINDRNSLLQTNRASRTVLSVLQSILDKEHLDKVDLSLIIDKILVYEAQLDIHLKPDIELLLSTGKWSDDENFNSDSEDNGIDMLVQDAIHQKDKVFAVNVVRDGDPLEIFTEKDGEVIFKKYSPMGELSEFADQICESLGRNTGRIAAVSDRDSIIALSGAPRRELMDKQNSRELERIMEQRKPYRYSGGSRIRAAESVDGYYLGVAAPILAEGDLMGCVMVLMDDNSAPMGDAEQKVCQTVAGFLGRQMES